MHAFVPLSATVELVTVVVVMMPELVGITPVDAGAAATERYGFNYL